MGINSGFGDSQSLNTGQYDFSTTEEENYDSLAGNINLGSGIYYYHLEGEIKDIVRQEIVQRIPNMSTLELIELYKSL